ncbi:MAG: fibrobacter succinogenes major paralogous domain-containing protein [Bacteroidetes bacterium]|nr:fibrobacter succinogenes major paralogous domain-containing protein [Bacteroidota bacterium]
MKKIIRLSIFTLILGFAMILSNSCKKDDNNSSSLTVTDADGNVYHTVTIGTQVWMVENLRTTKYNDGSPITPVTDNSVWASQTTEAYCWYNNDEAAYRNAYGALYNWYAVNTGKLCPAGWKVPSDADWAILIAALGGDSTTVGGKLKESGTLHWTSPNTSADNSSGFTALPGGSRYVNGGFYLNGKYGWYWSTNESTPATAWHEYFQYNSAAIYRTAGYKSDGFSVKCIKGSNSTASGG